MRRLSVFSLGLILAIILVVLYARLSYSQKRTILHLLRQAPYLPARYFV
jgi:hypothetical protein